ncbi:MAG: helix-turn-helix transcriptional regulator, partial [Reinekea sp.]|nr:helix-turn-helix transcriptional regulator [Reinekea sp.]
QLIRSFKARFGQTPHAYQLDSRIKRAKQLLRSGQALSSVALELGFADQAHFQRHFKRRLAVTPKVYQSNLLGC